MRWGVVVGREGGGWWRRWRGRVVMVEKVEDRGARVRGRRNDMLDGAGGGF